MMYRQVENNEIISADDDANGRFVCSVDKDEYKGQFFRFLEIAKGCTWGKRPEDRRIVFRVSEYSGRNISDIENMVMIDGVQLGNCAILNKEQVANAIALLQKLYKEM